MAAGFAPSGHSSILMVRYYQSIFSGKNSANNSS